MTYSPDGKHFAYVAADGNQVFIVQDGKKSPAYEDIGQGSPYFSQQSDLEYAAQRGGKWLVVAAGRERERYDDLGSSKPYFFARKVRYFGFRGGSVYSVEVPLTVKGGR